MTIHQLYRGQILSAVGMGVLSLVLGALAFAADLRLLIPSALFFIAAVMIYKVARYSYRLDLGLAGPPECRALVLKAREWERNGYRTVEEIASGIPPRARPPGATE